MPDLSPEHQRLIETVERSLYDDVGRASKEALAALDALALKLARLEALEKVVACDHPEGDWQYVEHEGKTWNECDGCGLMELWEAGMRVRQDFRALLAAREETGDMTDPLALAEKEQMGRERAWGDIYAQDRQESDLDAREHAGRWPRSWRVRWKSANQYDELAWFQATRRVGSAPRDGEEVVAADDYDGLLARLEKLEEAAQHYLDGTDPDGYVNLRALLAARGGGDVTARFAPVLTDMRTSHRRAIAAGMRNRPQPSPCPRCGKKTLKVVPGNVVCRSCEWKARP